jgi:serpin B
VWNNAPQATVDAGLSRRDSLISRRDLLWHASALACLGAAPSLAWAATGQNGAPRDVPTLTDAYNSAGRQLFEGFVKAPGNIIFSPYSIGVAMAMALSGARGATERETARVLGQRLTRSRMELANQTAIAMLTGDRPTQQSSRVLIANALMLTRPAEDSVLPDYIAVAKTRYAAEVFKNATLDQINGWVSERTEGRIDRILDSLDANSAAVLISAIYLKAAWEAPFHASATQDGTFNLASGAKVNAPMMHHKLAQFAWQKGSGYRAIRLPFERKDLGFIVVLPDAVDGLGDVIRGLDVARQKTLFAALALESDTPVELSMPKFEASFETDLVKPFQSAGLNIAFSDNADFSGVVGREHGVRITQIRHRAAIAVAEEGVEATAATAVEMSARSGYFGPVETFAVDRPFLFFIVDRETGAVLFEGRIVDPTEGG